MSDAGFVPGLELARGFFADLVEPLLRSAYPDLGYTAALVGHGSEVLGFDTPMSTDHHWGPRLMLFLTPDDHASLREDIRGYLGDNLPRVYRGYSTHFTPPDPNDDGVRRMAVREQGPVDHRVEMLTIEGFCRSYLNLGVDGPLSPVDWLSVPSQKLRGITSGAVFRDDVGLEAVRRRLSWYPRDVWLYILGCLWTRIGQEEHLMGRAGHVGDELGSSLIGSRLVRDIMRIAFCLERQYPPYPKWLGTAFGRLVCAPELGPTLQAAVHARTWQERQSALCPAYESLIRRQRAVGIEDGVSDKVSPFWGRPFLVIQGGRIATAVFSCMEDPGLHALARRWPVGSIDLISDSTDVMESTEVGALLRGLYRM